MNVIKRMDTVKRAKIALIVICCVLYLQTMSSSLIAYIMQSYNNIDPTNVKLLLTIPGMIGLFVSFAVGPISMKINKKYMIIFCALCSLTYFVLFAAVGANGPFKLLILAAVFMGISQGSTRTLTTSVISDFLQPKEKASFCALTTALQNGGGAVINLIGGSIAAGNGGADWPKAYLLGLIILPAVIVFALFMPKEAVVETAAGTSAAAGEEQEQGFIPPKVLLVILCNTVFAIGVCSFQYNFSEYIIVTHKLGTSVEASMVNSLYLVVGLIVGVIYPVFMKLFKRFIAPVGYCIFALGVLMMITIHTNIFVVYLSTIMIGVGFNIGNPFASAFVMQITPKKWVPVAISLLFGGVNLGMFFSTYILKFFSGFLGGGVQNTLTVGCIAGLLCAACAVVLYSMDPRSKLVVGEK